MSNSLPEKIRFKTAQLGLPGTLRCLGSMAALKILQRKFRFPDWHARAAFPCQPYKKRAVEIANTLGPETAVEVGCGLGEIISRIAARRRYGLDIDPQSIAGARFLHGRKAEFALGSFAELAGLPVPAIDLCLALNFLHELPPAQVREAIAAVRKQKSIKFLLVDQVRGGIDSTYYYQHSFAGLFHDMASLRGDFADGGTETRRLLLMEFHPA